METEFVQSTQLKMGTVMTHKAFGRQAQEGLKAVQAEAERLEALFSRFLPQSEISRVNCSAGKNAEKVSQETFELLSQALEFSCLSQGKFDVTIGPLLSLWHDFRDSEQVPDKHNLGRALQLVNYHDLELDTQAGTAALRKPGQFIDPGGIGKGFAADRFMDIFREYQTSSTYCNLGGNVAVLGSKPDGSPWKVGIQHPRREKELIGVLSAKDESVVTSGDYQRYFTDSRGIRQHHILDPRTGYPARSGLISVTIVTKSSLVADSLSTILFLTGLEKGLQVLRAFPKREAVLMDEALQVYITKGLKDRFTPQKTIRPIFLD